MVSHQFLVSAERVAVSLLGRFRLPGLHLLSGPLHRSPEGPDLPLPHLPSAKVHVLLGIEGPASLVLVCLSSRVHAQA